MPQLQLTDRHITVMLAINKGKSMTATAEQLGKSIAIVQRACKYLEEQKLVAKAEGPNGGTKHKSRFVTEEGMKYIEAYLLTDKPECTCFSTKLCPVHPTDELG